MARSDTKKLRAGVGATASIITRFLIPKQVEFKDQKEHRSVVVLVSHERKNVNRKMQDCYNCTKEGVDGILFACKRYFKVETEGNADGFFDGNVVVENHGNSNDEINVGPFDEPKTKWKKSAAKRILYNMILDGEVSDEADKSMPLRDIYMLHPEFAKYKYENFSRRLAAMRKKIRELNNRAREDLHAFEVYKSNHQPSLFSHKGYIQWQGSTSQECLWDDMDAGKHLTMKPMELWKSRKVYRDEFPLDAFRKKLEQEIRTAKYVHTLRERGILHRAS